MDRNFESVTKEEILEEEKRIRRLRFLVDFTAILIRQENMALEQAYQLVEAMKHQVLSLFPDKLETYNLLLKPRFDRIIREKFRIN